MQFAEGKESEYRIGYNNNLDSYGHACYIFAEAWADLMEKEIYSGVKLADIAKETSHKANTEGITGFMYGCAVCILANAWIYGEELRRWHNLNIQIRNEGEKANESGGVLNPAILDIG